MAQKLLLADDSITIQKVVELVLAEEGFDIKATSNGEDALHALSSFGPDVVLADIDMPRMNGYQLCEKIKANPETKKVPVILMAGAFEPLDEELARNVGADDYIVKPFESQELISKINSVLLTGEIAREAAVEETFEAEAVEAASPETDMWAIEEIPSEPAAAMGLKIETPIEEISSPDIFETAEEAAEEVEEGSAAVEEGPREITRVRPPVAAPAVEFISKEEANEIFRKEVGEKVSSLLLSLNVKDLALSSISQSMKESVERVLWEIAPEISERLMKEVLQGALAPLTKEIEKVIWETVPDLAERLISREIEKIKSEI